MDIREGGGKGNWDHYFLVGIGLIVLIPIAATIIWLLLSILSAGLIPLVITVGSIWGFVWVVCRIVKVGRENNWFDKIEKF